jgi:putative transposase
MNEEPEVGLSEHKVEVVIAVSDLEAARSFYEDQLGLRPGPRQAVWTRQRNGASLDSVVAHTDRGSQYVSIRYTERLAAVNIAASVGSVGSSYDNALAETINGLYKTELIKPRGPWRTLDLVEIATAEWVDWFNHRRLYEHCGDIPPAEAEERYYAQQAAQPTAELSHQ